jgi:hypothetical protein
MMHNSFIFSVIQSPLYAWFPPQSAKRGNRARGENNFEGESENDDDIEVYDSDNDPNAERVLPLDENYHPDEVYEGEDAAEMDSFITAGEYSPVPSEDASFLPSPSDSDSSTMIEDENVAQAHIALHGEPATLHDREGESDSEEIEPDQWQEIAMSEDFSDFEEVESEETCFNNY